MFTTYGIILSNSPQSVLTAMPWSLRVSRSLIQFWKILVARQNVTTDWHRGVGVYMRVEWKDASQFYDIWHISKGYPRDLPCINSNFPSSSGGTYSYHVSHRVRRSNIRRYKQYCGQQDVWLCSRLAPGGSKEEILLFCASHKPWWLGCWERAQGKNGVSQYF